MEAQSISQIYASIDFRTSLQLYNENNALKHPLFLQGTVYHQL